MSYLYSLYDALVSIAVPADKARAVVDAMEHDMATTLATKPDLENLRLATKADIENLRLAMKADLDNLRTAATAEIESLRLTTQHDISLLRKDLETGLRDVSRQFDSLHRELSQDIAAERKSVVIQLGGMMVVCFGLALTLVRLWL